MIGAPRSGPLFSGVPWVSLATFYNATIAINAALVAREITGRGQHVHTSMLQGALATTVGAWQRAEHADREGFNSWIFDPRAPKGFFQGSDGRWTHHWVPLPAFILNAAELDRLEPGPDLMSPRDAPMRISPAAEDMIVIHALQDQMAAAVAKFPADDWVALAAAGRGAGAARAVARGGAARPAPRRGRQRRRGRRRPAWCGRTYQFDEDARAADRRRRRSRRAHRRGARRGGSGRDGKRGHAAGGRGPPRSARRSRACVVLDLGLAVAGPFGTQLLADLGATVIKVNNALFDGFWMRRSIAMCCNRGKRSIPIDLKDPDGHGDAARPRADRRRRAAQHALRRGRAPRCRLRVARARSSPT